MPPVLDQCLYTPLELVAHLDWVDASNAFNSLNRKGWYTICNATQGGTDARHTMLTRSICEQSENCILAADALCRLNRAEFKSCVYFVVLRAKNGCVFGVFYK